MQIVGDCIVQAANDGADVGLLEVAFSFDNINFVTHNPSSVDLNNGDGSGLPAGVVLQTWLPRSRPPYIRVRGKAQSTNTQLNVSVFQMSAVEDQARRGIL